jgi:squalene-hopene/tetraprenyl-beta-curcumene cyclase
LLLLAFRLADTAVAAPDFLPARPDEPMAKEFSLKHAASVLDASALVWKQEHQCVQCHANFLYLIARPALASVATQPRETRELLEWLVSGRWEEKGLRYPAEAMVVAVPLAFDDAATTGRLHPLTRRALDRMLSLQRADGSWQWVTGAPKAFVREFELTMFAALGLAVAPDDYAQSDTGKLALDRIRRFAQRHPPTTAFGKGMLIWAATRVKNLQPAQERHNAAEELLALQGADGGWAIENVIVGCKTFEEVGFSATRPSDGYATGFVVFQARNAGVPANDARLQRGLAWLRSNQRESGRWFVPSFNKRPNHVQSNSGTAFAILALQACGEIPAPTGATR